LNTATTATTANAALRPRPPRGMGRGLALAVAVHGLLIAALAFSVRWRSSEPAGVEAELWAAVPQIAAPLGSQPEPARPEPKPEPKPTPKAPEPVAEKQPDAQIAVERAKRDDARREEARRQEIQREAEQRDRQREKADEERKQKEMQDKAKKEQQRLDDAREAQMQRILGQAGATGDSKATGNAARTSGPSAGYAGRIKARIKPNIIFADSVAGNPEAVVQVRVAPDGTITSRKLMRSSGMPAYDDAVLRAIDKTEILPRDTDGTVPPVMELTFRPNE